ncbi:MAG: alpha/beta fold hydrolase [Chloroflexi bacterium]|nr:alpha/beta fold hydrolase [Chloroflexota bacterium]
MRRIEFKSDDATTLRGVLFEPMTPRPHPVIVFAHGLLSTHDEFGDYPARFCERGYMTLAFDFRGHGASDGLRGYISEERWVADLRHALDYIEANPAVDNDRIALFGHSFGGGAVICATARDARVRAVVAGATVGRLRDEIAPSEMSLYKIVDSFNRFQKSFTRHPLYLPYRVGYKDIFADDHARINAERQGFLQRWICADSIPNLFMQDALACAANVRVPALIVQSELDRVVNPASTRKLFDAIPSEKAWYVVPGSGHSFVTDAHGAEAFEHIAAWMDRNLSKQ